MFNSDDFAEKLEEVFDKFGVLDGMTPEEEEELAVMFRNEFEAPWRNVKLSAN